jgi:hypothetical protein
MLATRVDWGYYRFLRCEDKIKIIIGSCLCPFYAVNFFFHVEGASEASFQVDSNALSKSWLSADQSTTEVWETDHRPSYGN